MESLETEGKIYENHVTFSEAALNSAIAKNSLIIPCEFVVF